MRTVLGHSPQASTIFPVSSGSIRNNTASQFVNQNFLAAVAFPLAILPSGLPADLHYKSHRMWQQISFGIEQDLGHAISRSTSRTTPLVAAI